ncbi:sulfotransferase 1C2-like [Mytilus californianus]|uniref:sulfotransferase 1C2-like n=1 Tax=Mytilus californianus TaxID=6549 RepID=UPI002245E24B|nr:sulfotransferase 1C2-like [Mytilus californianus]
MSNKGERKLFTYGPITKKDEVINVALPGGKESEYLLTDEYETRIIDRKVGFYPDPRVLIPQTQNMDVYDDDIFVCAYPKCGTHWVWEMCQMLVKGEAEYHQKAKESCMMEFHLPEDYNDLQRPRIFNTHFTPRCLPKKISDTKCKIILILRNPKDIITSLYHHILVTKSMDQNFDFSQFLQYTFENDRSVGSNWFFYNKRWSEFVSSTDQPVLILNYEDLKTNIIECLSEIGQFIGYPRDIELLQEIEDKCTVSKMREIEKRRDSGTEVSTGERISNLYRKGVIGDWKNHFTVADNERFDAFLKENMEEKHSLYTFKQN